MRDKKRCRCCGGVFLVRRERQVLCAGKHYYNTTRVMMGGGLQARFGDVSCLSESRRGSTNSVNLLYVFVLLNRVTDENVIVYHIGQ